MTERSMSRCTRHALATALACLSALSACTGETTPGSATPSESATATAVPTPATPSAAPDTAPADARGAAVALDGEGLRLVDTATGAARAIAFGIRADDAIVTLTRLLGEPIVRSTNRDCGAGPLDFVAFDGGLFIAIQNDRFVGWTVRPTGDTRVSTMSGIGIGSTRSELVAAYDAKITRSTLGTEFFAGGLQGVLASSAADARITDFWAGANCVAR